MIRIMIMRKKIEISLLALLFMGSAPLWAQDDTTEDPFDPVNYNQYSDNMTFFGQVRMNGEIQPDGTIVAVFCGEEIRGKGVVQKNGNKEHTAKIIITGETKGDPLHFKVCTGGRVIEVDQGATFNSTESLGSRSNYYYIDLPAPVVTTPSSEGWSTTCVPFNAKIPDGVTIYAATGIEGQELKVAKIEGGKILPANTPVLVESNSADGGSVEWLSRVADGDVTIAKNLFLGTTEPKEVAANSVLTLGHHNDTGEIGFWRYTGTEVPANRAYLADVPAEVKGLVIDFEDGADGIMAPKVEQARTGWYDLNGRKLYGKPTQRGIYINNGNKTVVK